MNEFVTWTESPVPLSQLRPWEEMPRWRGSPRALYDRFDQIKSPARKRGQVMEELSREGHSRAYHIAGSRWLRKCHTDQTRVPARLSLRRD